MNACTSIAAAAAISFIAPAATCSTIASAAIAPGETAATGVAHTPGPMVDTGVYRLADTPDIAAICTVGADGRRTLLPVEALDSSDLRAGVGLGWQGDAPLPVLPGMVVTADGQSMAYSGETHFGMPTVDGMPVVQTRAYSGETHFGPVLDAFDELWWLAIDASGETHFGYPMPDRSMRWQKSAPAGARPLVQRSEAVVSSGPAGCGAKEAVGAAADAIAEALTAKVTLH